jgi:hypothetical protein
MHLKFELKLDNNRYNIETIGGGDIEDIMATLSKKIINMVKEDELCSAGLTKSPNMENMIAESLRQADEKPCIFLGSCDKNKMKYEFCDRFCSGYEAADNQFNIDIQKRCQACGAVTGGKVCGDCKHFQKAIQSI